MGRTRARVRSGVHRWVKVGVVRRKKKRGNGRRPHGVNPKTFPLSVREYVECDYLQVLNQEEIAWLARFNDRYHGADFRQDEGETAQEDRREAYRRKNAANNDLWAVTRATGLAITETVLRSGHDKTRKAALDSVSSEHELDAGEIFEEPPEYLQSEEYKQALADLRELLPRNPRNKLVDSPRLRAAFRRLELAKRGYEGFEE